MTESTRRQFCGRRSGSANGGSYGRPRRKMISGISLVTGVAVLATACSSGGSHPAAQANGCKQMTHVTLASGSPSILPAFSTYTSIPQAMGFFAKQCIDFKVIALGGAEASTQALAVHKADVAVTIPITLYGVRSKGSDVVAVYQPLTRNIYTPVVLADSKYQKIGDLDGAKFGLASLVAGTDIELNLLAKQLGWKHQKTAVANVGLGAGALEALKAHRVDALFLPDASIATYESQGAQLRELRDPTLDQLSFVAPFAVQRTFLEQHRDVVVGFFKAVAEGTVFALANPQAAIQIHWKVFPGTAPPAGTDRAKALAQAVDAFKKGRLENVDPSIVDTRTDKRFGAMPDSEVLAYRNFLVAAGQLGATVDFKAGYTNDVLDDVNNFDHTAIQQLAKNYKSTN